MGMTIGRLAELTGVKIPTIRYYEQSGLMPEPGRTAANRRVYGNHAVQRLSFIRHSRALGFDVPAISDLLSLAGHPQASCRSVDDIAQRHLAEIDSKIARLSALRAEVARMLDECAHDRVSKCRVIEVLSESPLPPQAKATGKASLRA